MYSKITSSDSRLYVSLLAGVATIVALSGCTTLAEKAQKTEQTLAASGFRSSWARPPSSLHTFNLRPKCNWFLMRRTGASITCMRMLRTAVAFIGVMNRPISGISSLHWKRKLLMSSVRQPPCNNLRHELGNVGCRALVVLLKFCVDTIM